MSFSMGSGARRGKAAAKRAAAKAKSKACSKFGRAVAKRLVAAKAAPKMPWLARSPPKGAPLETPVAPKAIPPERPVTPLEPPVAPLPVATPDPELATYIKGEWTYVRFEDYGYFVFKDHNFNGHCHAEHVPHGGRCHIDRSWSESSVPGRGRVLGLVAFWLMSGHDYDHTEHRGAMLKRLYSSAAYRTERQDARNHLKTLGLYELLTAHERPKADPEEVSEPEDV